LLWTDLKKTAIDFIATFKKNKKGVFMASPIFNDSSPSEQEKIDYFSSSKDENRPLSSRERVDKMRKQMQKDLEEAEMKFNSLADQEKKEWIKDRIILQKRMQDIPLTTKEIKRVTHQFYHCLQLKEKNP
jgi:hypothetical protein